MAIATVNSGTTLDALINKATGMVDNVLDKKEPLPIRVAFQTNEKISHYNGISFVW